MNYITSSCNQEFSIALQWIFIFIYITSHLKTFSTLIHFKFHCSINYINIMPHITYQQKSSMNKFITWPRDHPLVKLLKFVCYYTDRGGGALIHSFIPVLLKPSTKRHQNVNQPPPSVKWIFTTPLSEKDKVAQIGRLYDT